MLTYADVCWQGSFERQLILVPANSTLAALLAQIAREVSLGTQAGIDPEIELHFFDTDGEVLDLRSFFFFFSLFFWHFFDKELRSLDLRSFLFFSFFLAFLRQGAPLSCRGRMLTLYADVC
jgi:hypothetical protein